jgi:hypothetical protein
VAEERPHRSRALVVAAAAAAVLLRNLALVAEVEEHH